MKGFLAVRLASSVLLLLLVAATVASAASTLPVPTGKQAFNVSAAEVPQVGNDPAHITPIGIGPFADNLDTIDIKVGLAPFAAAVDLYFVVYIPDLDKAFIYYTGADDEPFTLVPTAWKKNVTGSVSETLNYLSNISSSQLPETTYYLGLVAVPAGSPAADPAAYYIWVTQFRVVTNGRTLTLVSNCGQEIWAAGVGNNVGKICKRAEDCTGFECKDGQCTDYACNSHSDCTQPNSYCSELAKSSKTDCSGGSGVCGEKQFCGRDNKLCSWRSCSYVPLPVIATDILEPQKTCSKNSDCCTGSACTQFCYVTEGVSGLCARVPSVGRGNYWQIAPGKVQPQTLTMAVPTPWGGRFWPRTGCGLQGSLCTDLWAGTDAQCGPGRSLTATSHKYDLKCRADSNCGPSKVNTTDIGGKCVKDGMPSFDSAVPATSECTPGADTTCDAKYPGQNRVCYGHQVSTAKGIITIGQCGFYYCTSYQCSGLGKPLCEPRTFACATGNCTDANGASSKSCANSGTGTPTVAELFMRSLKDGSDFYDVSMVDGANVPVQLSPDTDTYDMTTADAVKSVSSCTTDADCIIKNNDGTKDTSWVCSTRNDSTRGKCINRLVCGAPGCVSDCAGYGFGLTPKSAWGGRDLAITKDACPQSLEFSVGGSYVGCMSPKDACLTGTDYQKQQLLCATHIDQQGSYLDLYQCSGPNSGSCYSAGATTSCCGCPSWSFAQGAGCVNHNPYWEKNIGPEGKTPQALYKVFNTASPSSYTFPFDDKNALFTCKGKPRDAENPNGVGVNYTITFCPK